MVHLIELETRRRVLFTDSSLTIRSLDHVNLLLTAESDNPLRFDSRKVTEFFFDYSARKQVHAIVLDCSRLKSITHVLSLEQIIRKNVSELIKIGVYHRTIRGRCLLYLINMFSNSKAKVQVFESLPDAINWVKKI